MKTLKEHLSDSKTTAIKLAGVYGKVHCSIDYMDDEPNWLSFSQHRENENGELEYHRITLEKDEIPKLIELLKENEMI